MKFYKNTEIPRISEDDKEFSVDVIISDPGGMLNIGFYVFEDKRWNFHTDTLYDFYEGDILQPFVWWYAPTERTEQF